MSTLTNTWVRRAEPSDAAFDHVAMGSLTLCEHKGCLETATWVLGGTRSRKPTGRALCVIHAFKWAKRSSNSSIVIPQELEQEYEAAMEAKRATSGLRGLVAEPATQPEQ